MFSFLLLWESMKFEFSLQNTHNSVASAHLEIFYLCSFPLLFCQLYAFTVLPGLRVISFRYSHYF